MSDSKINLVAHIHPFAPSERITRELDPGMSVQEIVESLGVKIGNPVVYIDGERVIHEAWPFRKAHEGQHVLVKVIPAGTDGVQQAGGIVGAAGGLLILFGLILAIPTAGASLAFVAAGIAIGATGLAVGLGATVVEKFGQTGQAGVAQESVLSIRGGSNQTPSLGTKIPVILGKHLVTPYYAARPYTNISTVTTAGDTQHLRMLFCLGLAPLRVSQIKIGENLLASNSAAVRNGALTCDGIYSDVSAEIFQDGTNPTLYPYTTIEEQPGIELKSGIEHWLTSAKNTDRIHVDVTLQSGLYQYNDAGTKLDHSVTVEVRRRAVGSGTAWASCTLVGTFSLTAKLAKTLRYDIATAVTVGQYEVGMKRITTDDAEGSKKQSVVTWSAFRSQRTTESPVDAAVRSKYVFLALYIKATSQLSGVVSKLNCICESEVPVWNGSTSGQTGWTGTGFSQNPAALYLWALRGGMNPRPIADANIDWARIEALYTTCATKGWTCNAVVASETRLRDMLNKIGSTARSTFAMRDGKYSVVVDEVKTSIVQHFTPRNVKNFSWSKGFADLPYGALINFVSATDGYDSNQRIVPYDGYTEAQAEAKLDEFDLWGVTDPALVYKQGRYRLAVAQLRPEIMSFETDAEGIVCEPGDLVVVSHDAIVVGHGSGRVKSVLLDGSNNAIGITTDELLTMAAGQSYGIRFRRASDGGSVYTTITTVVGETNSLSFAVAIPAANKPAVGDLFTFGTAGIETARSIVAAIESMEDLACKIYVVDEAPGVHTADSGVIPEFNSRVSPPASAAIIDVVDEVSLEVRPVDIALEAATIAALAAAADAAADAATAQSAATAAQGSANTANNLLADIAADTKFTPVEKQAARTEWDAIYSEKALIDTQATAFGITTEKTAYGTAYTNLANYLHAGTWTPGATPPLWLQDAQLSVTVTIVAATFRATWKAYYDARTTLLNAIAAKAKTLADAAQSTANTATTNAATAQSTANTAVTNAATAQNTANTASTNATNALAALTDIASDSVLTPGEKPAAIQARDVIVAEQAGIDAQATAYASTAVNAAKTAYDAAVTALTTYLATLTAPVLWTVLTGNTTIVGATFRTKFNDVYSTRQALLNAIYARAKALADAAQTAATNAATEAALAGTTLRLSAQTIVRSRAGALLPAALTVSALTQASAAYAGRFRIELSHDGITYQSAVYNSAANESSYAYTVPATMVVSTVTYFVASIRVSLFAAGGTAKLLGQALCAVAADPSTAASHLGIGILSALSTKAFAGATVDEDGTITTTGTISQVFIGDTVVNYAASGGVATLGLYKWSGTAWVKTTAIKDLTPSMNDLFGLNMAGITIADATTVSLLIAKNILAENVDVTGQLTVQAGGRIRYETGSGVQKRCVQLADEKIDWLDTPDTSPATAEQLCARIGRIGAGGRILLNGDFAASIDSSYGEPYDFTFTGTEPISITLANQTERFAWATYGVGLREKTRPVGGTWGATSTITGYSYFIGRSDYIQRRNGQVRCCYTKSAGGGAYSYIGYEKVLSGSAWGVEKQISNNAPQYIQGMCYLELPDETLIVSYDKGDGKQYWKIYDDTTETWGPEILKFSFQMLYHDAMISTENIIYQAYTYYNGVSTYVRLRRSYDNGDTFSTELDISSFDAKDVTVSEDEAGRIYFAYIKYSDNHLYIRTMMSGALESETDTDILASEPVLRINPDANIVISYKSLDAGNNLKEITLQRYAQIGAGIVESGSNSNGSWVKYGDGTMECWGHTQERTWGAGAEQFTYSLPAAFIGEAIFALPAPRPVTYWPVTLGAFGSGYTFYIINNNTGAAQIISHTWHAIGRWKA